MENLKSILEYKAKDFFWICPDCETENHNNEKTCILCRYTLTDMNKKADVSKQQEKADVKISSETETNYTQLFIAVLIVMLLFIILLLVLQQNDLLI